MSPIMDNQMEKKTGHETDTGVGKLTLPRG